MKETWREREMGQESTAQGISKAGTEERQRRTGQWEGAEERSFRAYLEREEKSRNTVEKYLRDAIEEYCKRLGKYCKLEIIQVADEKTPENASQTVEDQIRQKEGERILKYLKDDAYVITLEIGGNMLDSVEFSKKIENLGIQGKSHIIFVIGGSIGLGREVLKRSDYALSFSKMTFPHQLMRVILLEQIYRGYRIMAGEPYHK